MLLVKAEERNDKNRMNGWEETVKILVKCVVKILLCICSEKVLSDSMKLRV